MYPISNDLKKWFLDSERQKCKLTITLTDSTVVNLNDSHILKGGLEIDRNCLSSTKIELGTAIASELYLALDNTSGSFDSVSFEGATIKVEIGVRNQYIPYGIYVCDEATKQASSYIIKALDRMVDFDTPVPSSSFFTNKTIKQLVTNMCTNLGITLYTDLDNLVNHSYQPANNVYVKGITYRQVLIWCCQLMGACAYIDWDGKLRIQMWGENVAPNLTTSERFNSSVFEQDIVIDGISLNNNGVITNEPNSPTYVIKIENNYLFQDTTKIVDLKTAVIGVDPTDVLSYRPFSATTLPLPHLYPLDGVYFVDKNNVSHYSYITHTKFSLNKNMTIESVGTTQVEADYGAIPVQYVTHAELGDSQSSSYKQITTITEDTVKTTNVVAENLHVKVANIDGSITANAIMVKDVDDNTVFSANATNHLVRIGGFSVNMYSIHSMTDKVYIYSGNDYAITSLISVGNSFPRFWAGSNTPSSAPFKVLEDGSLYASAALITGHIQGSSITGGTIVIENPNQDNYKVALGVDYSDNTGVGIHGVPAIELRCPYNTITGDPDNNYYMPLCSFWANNKKYYFCIYAPMGNADITTWKTIILGSADYTSFISHKYSDPF